MLKFDIELQQQIISLSLDDSSPIAMLPNTCGGPHGDTPQMWRESVLEFICHMLDADFIAAIAGIEGYEKKSTGEISKLLRHGNDERGLDAELMWYTIYFAGTKKLDKLLRDLQMDCWEALNMGLSPSLGRALVELQITPP